MTTEIAYRVITKALDTDGRPVKFESFDKKRAQQRAEDCKASDPRSRVIGIPVVGR